MKTKTELLLEADLLLAELLKKRREYEELSDENTKELDLNPCLTVAVRIATLVGRIEGIMWAIGKDNNVVRTKEPKPKRSHESMKKDFFTIPGDVFTIKHISNTVSNNIAVHIVNVGHDDDFYISLANHQHAWQALKDIGETASRTVLFQIDDQDPVPYVQSSPYTHRFPQSSQQDQENGANNLESFENNNR